MGFWERLKAAVTRGSRKGTGLEASRWTNAPPRKGTRDLLAAYREMPWLRTIVDVVSDGVASGTWRVYRRKSSTGAKLRDLALQFGARASRAKAIKSLSETQGLEEIPDHPLLQVIYDPNDYLSGRAVLKLLQNHLDLVGEAFLLLERRAGKVVGYWPVPPTWVLLLPDLTAPKAERSYLISVAGKAQQRFPAADVIHLRQPDLDDPMGRGVGAAFALGDELDTDEYAARFTKNAFWNNMVPAAVVSVEGMNDTASAAAVRFKERLSAEHQGPDKAGRLLVTSGKVTFARLDTTFKDMDLVPLRKFLMGFVRMTYRVPPEIVGDISNSNRATAYAAREILAEQATEPRLEFLRTELQMRLVPEFGDDLVLEYDSPVPADKERQLDVMKSMPEAFSYDEWRGLADFRPDPARQGYPLPLPGQAQSAPPAEAAPVATDEAKGLPADPPWATARI